MFRFRQFVSRWPVLWAVLVVVLVSGFFFVRSLSAQWATHTGIPRAGLYAYNGSSWDTIMRQADNGDGVSGWGGSGNLSTVAKIFLFNGSTFDRLRSVPGRNTGTQAVGVPGRIFSDLSRDLNGAGTTLVEFTTSANELLDFNSLNVTLDCPAGTGTSPTLDVYIQVSADGSTWNDRIHFNQCTTTAKQQEGSVTTSGMGVVTYTDATIAGGSIRDGTFPGRARIKYVVAGTTPRFNPVSTRIFAK